MTYLQVFFTFELFPLLSSYKPIIFRCSPASSSHLRWGFHPFYSIFLLSCLPLSFFVQFFFFIPFFFKLVLPIYNLFCPSDCLLPYYKSSFFHLYIRSLKKLFLSCFESLSLVQTYTAFFFSYWLPLFKHFHAHL